jgi:XTP/dITP diphosphohydrolase
LKLVIATGNAAKAGEMKAILQDLLPGWEMLSLADFPETPEPEETGHTYAENAAIKAEAAAKHTGELCVADDAGLEIDAMDGAPGVKSKRFAGVDSPFTVKIAMILDHLAANPDRSRTARFRCAVAVAAPQASTRVFESTKEGVIADVPRGTNGFGYDPIFVLPDLDKTYAELETSLKNRISHRALVLAEASKRLSDYGGK